MSFCDLCLREVPIAQRPPLPPRRPWSRRVAEPDPPDAVYCHECSEELQRFAAAAMEERRPIWEKRPSRASLTKWLIGLGILGAVLVPAWIVAGYAAKTPLTAEEVARIAVGLRRGFTSLEGTNVLLSVYGGSFVSASKVARDGHHPQALVDSFWQDNVADWRSRNAEFPVELVFKAALNSSMGKLILRVRPDSPPESWPRNFELLVSVTSPDSGYKTVLAAEFPRDEVERLIRDSNQRPEALVPIPLRFTFSETRGVWVMLRILTNHGHRGFTSLAEIEVYPAESPG